MSPLYITPGLFNDQSVLHLVVPTQILGLKINTLVHLLAVLHYNNLTEISYPELVPLPLL